MKYFEGIGRRKTSIATLRLYNESGVNTINDQSVDKFYPHKFEVIKLLAPFKSADLLQKEYYFTTKVKGGGKESQLEAIRHALARAIVKMYPETKKALKDAEFLKRDPRMVERKKPGLRKARKAEQYSKR